jgi:RNA polymerase sigma-32 factor
MDQPRLLSFSDELDLITRYQAGDMSALHELILCHRPLVALITDRCRRAHPGLAEDLMQGGFLGLLEAAKKFDVTKGARFGTYARWWVRAHAQCVLSRRGAVRLTTRDHRRVRNNLPAVRHRLEQHLGRTATWAELAEALNVSTESVREVMLLLTTPPVELTTIGNDASHHMFEVEAADHMFEVEAAEPPPDEFAHERRQSRRMKLVVASLLSQLDGRERAIVERRILSDDEQERLRDIGAQWGVSGARIHQIERMAIQKMRDAAKSQGVSVELLR